MNLLPAEVSLSALPLFEGLHEEQLKAILPQWERRSFRRGTALMLASENCGMVYLIQRGLVRICAGNCASGEVLLGVLGPGEIIGEIHALDKLGHSADVIAAQDCLCWAISATAFETCLRACPDMALNLLRMTSKRLRNTTDKIALLSTQDSAGRVARQLLILAQQCGVTGPDGSIEIPLLLSQSDIAALTGLSRQTVNIIFQRFRKIEAISTVEAGYIIIHKPALLAQRSR
jgi:CRP/FNR family transcriptional regulator